MHDICMTYISSISTFALECVSNCLYVLNTLPFIKLIVLYSYIRHFMVIPSV